MNDDYPDLGAAFKWLVIVAVCFAAVMFVVGAIVGWRLL